MEDQIVFIDGAFRAWVDGKLVGAQWPDRGSALAGLATEQRRAAARKAAPLPLASALACAAAEGEG